MYENSSIAHVFLPNPLPSKPGRFFLAAIFSTFFCAASFCVFLSFSSLSLHSFELLFFCCCFLFNARFSSFGSSFTFSPLAKAMALLHSRDCCFSNALSGFWAASWFILSCCACSFSSACLGLLRKDACLRFLLSCSPNPRSNLLKIFFPLLVITGAFVSACGASLRDVSFLGLVLGLERALMLELPLGCFCFRSSLESRFLPGPTRGALLGRSSSPSVSSTFFGCRN